MSDQPQFAGSGSPYVTPDDLSYAPGSILLDAQGHYWMVRDDGKTAAGTNGGVMVDLRRGECVYSPEERNT
jgi:hypothetical protein